MKVKIYLVISLWVLALGALLWYNIIKPVDKSRSCFIKCIDEAGSIKSGSGVLYDNGWVVTAGHVVDGICVRVYFYDGTMEETEQFFVSEDRDIAFIKVNRESKKVPIVLRKDLPEAASVYCVSCPMVWRHVIIKGSMVAENNNLAQWEDAITSDINILPGSSGGGLYYHSKLVGIVVGFVGVPQRTLTTVVSVEDIERFYQEIK